MIGKMERIKSKDWTPEKMNLVDYSEFFELIAYLLKIPIIMHIKVRTKRTFKLLEKEIKITPHSRRERKMIERKELPTTKQVMYGEQTDDVHLIMDCYVKPVFDYDIHTMENGEFEWRKKQEQRVINAFKSYAYYIERDCWDILSYGNKITFIARLGEFKEDVYNGLNFEITPKTI